MPKVLVTDHPFPSLDIERSLLEPLGASFELAPSADEETLVRLVGDANAVLVCYAAITPAVIAAAAVGGCRIFSRYGVGYDNIAVPEATRAGIIVTQVPDYCLDEVADHTVALLLAAARGVVPAARAVEKDLWEFPTSGINRLRGRRLALVGVGRIGRRVAERAQAFGLEVVGYDPYLKEWDVPGLSRAETIEEALAEADFVSLHAPLTRENRHLIDESTIATMRRAPVLVNTSRGGLVNLDAIVAALDAGTLGGAVLDVTELEPLPEGHPLRSHPRAIVTPHMAYYSAEAQHELQHRAASEVARSLRGEPPRCPVNPEVFEAWDTEPAPS